MPNFDNGKVYLMHNARTGLCYVGSTTLGVRDRFYRHRSNYNQHCKGNYRYCTSFALLCDEPDHAHVLLLEACPCSTKRELLEKEAEWIDKLGHHPGLVNKCHFASYNISAPEHSIPSAPSNTTPQTCP